MCVRQIVATLNRRLSSNIDSEFIRGNERIYSLSLRASPLHMRAWNISCLRNLFPRKTTWLWNQIRNTKFEDPRLSSTMISHDLTLKGKESGRDPTHDLLGDWFLEVILVEKCNVGLIADVFPGTVNLIVDSHTNHTSGTSGEFCRAISSPCSIGGTFLCNKFK